MRIEMEIMRVRLLVEFVPWEWAHLGTNSFEMTWSRRQTFWWPNGDVKHWLAEWRKGPVARVPQETF
jgi:hypothetical protein